MNRQLPEPFERKIKIDAVLRQPVINIETGRKLVPMIRRTRKECQALLKPSMGAGRAA